MEKIKLLADDDNGVKIFEITKGEIYVDQDGDLLCMSSKPGELHEIDYYVDIKIDENTTIKKLMKNIRCDFDDKKVKFEDMKYIKF